jgi:hypothetical protein
VGAPANAAVFLASAEPTGAVLGSSVPHFTQSFVPTGFSALQAGQWIMEKDTLERI